MAIIDSGLTIGQRGILAEISRSEPTTVGKLADALLMDPGALAHTLKPLERDGLVQILVDPEDRRRRLIGLTQEGRDRLEQTDGLWADAQHSFEAAFGRTEAEALKRVMVILTSKEFTSAFEQSLTSRR